MLDANHRLLQFNAFNNNLLAWIQFRKAQSFFIQEIILYTLLHREETASKCNCYFFFYDQYVGSSTYLNLNAFFRAFSTVGDKSIGKWLLVQTKGKGLPVKGTKQEGK